VQLSVAPRYFGELWAFLKNQRSFIEAIKNPDLGHGYPPWTAFATGIAIFLSILALDAAQSVRHFDRVVFFVDVLCLASIFIVIFRGVARVIGGKATLRQAIAGGEYLIGFLLPSLALSGYIAVLILNLFPGVNCSLSYLTLDSVVPTAFNHALVSLAISMLILGIAYCGYRSYAMFLELEQLSHQKTIIAMCIAVVPLIALHRWIEFMARLFARELRAIAGILTGSSD